MQRISQACFFTISFPPFVWCNAPIFWDDDRRENASDQRFSDGAGYTVPITAPAGISKSEIKDERRRLKDDHRQDDLTDVVRNAARDTQRRWG